MYDLANQSFTLLINTLFFAIYFRQVVVGDEKRGVALWGIIFPLSMLLVVIASPVVGAIADSRAWKKAILMGTGLVCVALTCSFGFIGPGTIVLAALLYIPANFCYQIGENFLASFLPQIAKPGNIGRVSAIGWSMGYIGALLLLLLAAAMMLMLGWKDAESWRPFFVFAGIWFLLFMIPPAIYLREGARPEPDARKHNVLALAHRRMMDTIRNARRYRNLMRFLAAFFIYGMGVQTVIVFAGIITTDDFKFGAPKLVLFVLQLTLTAGMSAVFTSRYQDRLGHRRTIAIFLCIWVGSAVGLALMSILKPPPEWLFWVLANGIGFGLGGIGTSSRALVGTFTPAHKTAEFFGLWGMVFKFAGVAGPLAFGQFKALLTGWRPSLATPLPLLLIAGFFLVGLAMLFRVNEREGLAAAREAEADEAKRTSAIPDTPGGVLPATPLDPGRR
jgi:MFS transporter, UMF1 family